jgi:hypothetical protein
VARWDPEAPTLDEHPRHMIVAPAIFPAMGFDTVQAFDADQAKALYAAGMRFFLGYLGSMTPARLAIGLNAGLAFVPVTFSRAPGWPGVTPSVELGQQDGNGDVAHLRGLSIPPGATTLIDLEGAPASAGSYAISQWGNARAAVLQSAMFEAGLYVGSGAGLNAVQLYDMQVTRYAKSLSQVPEPECGWSLVQLYKTVTIAGVTLDVQCTQYDYRDRLIHWVQA